MKFERFEKFEEIKIVLDSFWWYLGWLGFVILNNLDFKLFETPKSAKKNLINILTSIIAIKFVNFHSILQFRHEFIQNFFPIPDMKSQQIRYELHKRRFNCHTKFPDSLLIAILINNKKEPPELLVIKAI